MVVQWVVSYSFPKDVSKQGSEHYLIENQVEQLLGVKEDLEGKIILFVSKYHFVIFIHVYFKK